MINARDRLFHGLDMDVYLRDPGIGSSLLKSILTSPADFRYRQQTPLPETRAMNLGTAVHMWILEPDLFDERYAVPCEDWGPLNVNPGRAKWADFKNDCKVLGKEPLKYNDGIGILRICEAAKRNRGLQELLKDKLGTEISAAAKHEGIRYKARSDLISQGYLWDVKTSSKGLDDNRLERTIFENGYHFQAAHHMRVMLNALPDLQGFGWIFVNTGEGYPHVRVLKAASDWLHFGAIDWLAAHERLQQCIEKDTWPVAYPDDIRDINMPDWAIQMSQPIP